jgi:putative sterol carrier protein
MAMEVFTQEWAEACRDALNAHEGYRREGAQWESAVVLVMSPDAAAGVPTQRAFHLDLAGGGCRAVRVATDEDLATAPFVLAADPSGWREVVGGGADPVGLLMRGRLRLMRGGLMQLAKHAGAAKELLAATAQVPSRFPGD